MISQDFSMAQFFEHVQDMGLAEMIIVGCQECEALERISYGKKGAVKARELGSMDYNRNLGRFIFFLRSGVRPAGVSDGEFTSYRPVIEKLVQKGQFKSSILDVFRDNRH